MTSTAIVILNWNGVHFLREFLPLLKERSVMEGVEIIVADNASSDDSGRYLSEKHPDIRVIQLDQNYGFAGGYNRALEKIEADYFLLLNSDIEVSEHWLEPLIGCMNKHSEVVACSPLMLDLHNKTKYEYAGAAGGYIDKFGYTFCRGRLFSSTEKAADNFRAPLETFWSTGACMLIRSSAFRECGGFDPHFFAHMEEVDLCWRLKNRGYKLAVVPDSKVYHIGGGTLPKSNPFKTYLNFRNNLLMLYKNLPSEVLWKRLMARMLMDALSAGLFLVKLKFKDIAAIRRAHRHFRRDRKNYISFRLEQQELHGYPELQGIYNRSVVADYFLRGTRRFGGLRDNFGERMDNNIIN